MDIAPPNEPIMHTDSRVVQLAPVWSDIPDLVPPLSNDVKEVIAKEDVVLDVFIVPQYMKILEDAQNKFLTDEDTAGIGIRTIMVSREGPVELIASEKHYAVPDIETVLQNGTELNTGEILVAAQTKKQPITETSYHRVLQYLISNTKKILNTPDTEAKRKLTPAILIYDLSKLTQVDGYIHRLKDYQSGNTAILRMYLIDIDTAK